MKYGNPREQNNPSYIPITNISLIYQWVTESEDADTLTTNETYVLVRFIRKAMRERTNYIQEKIEKLLIYLKLSVNPFLKAVAGLEQHQLIQRVRDPEDSRAPMRYVFTLPPHFLTSTQDPNIIPTISTSDSSDLKEVLRCVLFLCGIPISIERLISITSHTATEIRDSLASLADEFKNQSLQLREVATGYQMVSRPEFEDYAKKVVRRKPHNGLTETEREILAILLYTAPITREGIGKIRGGIQPIESLNSLLKKKFVGVDHRDNNAPPLYSPTPLALQSFGMKDISEMPDRETLRLQALQRFKIDKIHYSVQAPPSI